MIIVTYAGMAIAGIVMKEGRGPGRSLHAQFIPYESLWPLESSGTLQGKGSHAGGGNASYVCAPSAVMATAVGAFLERAGPPHDDSPAAFSRSLRALQATTASRAAVRRGTAATTGTTTAKFSRAIDATGMGRETRQMKRATARQLKRLRAVPQMTRTKGSNQLWVGGVSKTRSSCRVQGYEPGGAWEGGCRANWGGGSWDQARDEGERASPGIGIEGAEAMRQGSNRAAAVGIGDKQNEGRRGGFQGNDPGKSHPIKKRHRESATKDRNRRTGGGDGKQSTKRARGCRAKQGRQGRADGRPARSRNQIKKEGGDRAINQTTEGTGRANGRGITDKRVLPRPTPTRRSVAGGGWRGRRKLRRAFRQPT